MGAISRPEVEKARERIAGFVRRTPVLELPAGLRGRAHPLALKLELHQYTGSFKPRGAFHRLLGEAIPAAGVVAASGGNHGAAVAFAASRLGVPVRVFMPTTTPRAKVQRVPEVRRRGRAHRGHLRRRQGRGGTVRRRVRGARRSRVRQSRGRGRTGHDGARVHGPGVVRQLAGGGGRRRARGGVCRRPGRAQHPDRRGGNDGDESLHAALEAGMPVDVQVSGLAADSLGARRVGEVPFAILRAAAERVVLVEDADLRAAQEALWDECRVLAEPGGAAALAAWLSGSYRATAAERSGDRHLRRKRGSRVDGLLTARITGVQDEPRGRCMLVASSRRSIIMVKGFTLPFTPRGLASLVPPPPWHYAGWLLNVDFACDCPGAAVRAHRRGLARGEARARLPGHTARGAGGPRPDRGEERRARGGRRGAIECLSPSAHQIPLTNGHGIRNTPEAQFSVSPFSRGRLARGSRGSAERSRDRGSPERSGRCSSMWISARSGCPACRAPHRRRRRSDHSCPRPPASAAGARGNTPARPDRAVRLLR